MVEDIFIGLWNGFCRKSVLTYSYANQENGKTLRRYWTTACQACAQRSKCTTGKERRISRWEHEAVLETVQARLDRNPDKIRVRRQTVEHPFGTIKSWMGSTHFHEVSSNVVLATLQALPSAGRKWRQRLFDKHADLIEREILAAAEAGADDAFPAFAAAARHWSWHDRDRLLRVFAALNMDDPATLDDNTRAACDELFAEAAKRPEGFDAGAQARALGYYEAIEAPQDFALQKHGQLLFEMNRADEAEAVLLRITEPSPFAFYWLSKAQLAQGKHDDSLVAIGKGLNGLPSGQSRYQTTFLAQRFEIRRALGDPAAREDLEEAHRLCEDPRYKAALEKRLAALAAA